MNIEFDAFMEGVKEASEDFFSMPNGALFPLNNSQAKWRYAKGDKFLRLADGQNVYHFDFPEGEHETESFKALRAKDPAHHEFASGSLSSGLAQVHRSDPSSIYFTLQEGRRNPTFTLKHTGGEEWRVIPKVRKKKLTPELNPSLPQSDLHPDSIKMGMDEELEKIAERSAFGSGLANTLNGVQHGLMFPGRNWETPWPSESLGLSNGLGAALAGGLAGGAYHLGKRHLYNSPEENAEEDEQGWKLPAMRMGIPALGMGLLSAAEGNLAPEYFKQVRTGNKGMFDIVPD